MLSALEQCQIEDVATNLALLKAILKDPAFKDARANTTYLEQNIRTLMGL
jgi:biotin carboxylase